MSVVCVAPRRPVARVALGTLAAGLLASAIAVVVATDAGWPWVAATVMAPDVALLLGWTRGLAPGQLHPRAVPLYNALHRFIGPILLAFVPGFLLGALAWALHIAVDRTVGYGLRTRDGFQRA